MKPRTKVALNVGRMLLVGAVLASAACAGKIPSEGAAVAAVTVAQDAPRAIAVTVPDGGWRLTIERILERPNEIWILAKLERAPGMATQAITTVTAPLPADLPAKPQQVFVAGKTWAWKNDEPYEFVPSLQAVRQRAKEARVLFPKDEDRKE